MKKVLSPLVLSLLLLLSACSLFQAQQVAPAGSNEQTLIARSVQETMAAAEGDPAQVEPPPGEPQPGEPQPGEPPPAGVIVTVSVDTNCRAGPGTVFESLGVLLPGQTAEVVGRSHNSDNWIIVLPSNPSITCWLWAFYATTSGDTAALPIIDSPPTPIPLRDFSINPIGTASCMANYWLRFELTNTGSIAWSSYQVTIYDATTSSSSTWAADMFMDATGCVGVVDGLPDLQPGQSGFAGNYGPAGLPTSPLGHNITANFILCSLDGLAGECIQKTITFTP